MKTLHTALLASSFLFVTYVAVPTPAHAGGKRCAQFVDTARAEMQTNVDIDVAIDVARHGLPIRSEVEALQKSVVTENFTYIGPPDPCVLQLMLDHELAQLVARAANYMANEADVRLAELQIVLGRYERAVYKIKLAWKNGEIAEDIAIQALAGLRIDADAYVQSLGLSSIRERLGAAMAELIARGQNAMDHVGAVQDTFRKLYELRLETSLAVLESRIAEGKFTKLDYERVQFAVEGLQKIQTFPTPGDCGS